MFQTLLHCAISSESGNAYSTAKLLLLFGANRDKIDSLGRRPTDVVDTNPTYTNLGPSFVELLTIDDFVSPRTRKVSKPT